MSGETRDIVERLEAAITGPYSVDGKPAYSINSSKIDARTLRDAIAEIKRLREALKDVRERCLFADDDGGIGVSEDVVIEAPLFERICALLDGKE